MSAAGPDPSRGDIDIVPIFAIQSSAALVAPQKQRYKSSATKAAPPKQHHQSSTTKAA